jgi:signal transduction histidine kinase
LPLVIAMAFSVSARSQIAPCRGQQTGTPSASSGAIGSKTSPTSNPTDAAPTAVLRGWSVASDTTDELAPITTRVDQPVTLDPGCLGIVLFFDVVKRSSNPAQFRYRLADYEASWTVTASQQAHYRKLSPGSYRFEVQARGPDGAWTAPAVLPVVQRAFFYQTWYFYVVLLGCVIVLAAQLLQQRDQLLKGQMGIVLEERNRIASDCHDTLMAGFAAISWQLEATAKLFRDSAAENTPMAASCELARSMVAHCQAEARRIIWDLRDTDDLTDRLSEALGRAIAAHRLRDTVETTFEVQGEEIPVAPGAVHHLVCIGQEAVSNAARHAGASSIHVTLRYGSDSLSLTVRDDGHGFHVQDSTHRTGHFGIAVMHERARKLGGTLRLTSSASTGTEVALTVSFHHINQTARPQHDVVRWIGV